MHDKYIVDIKFILYILVVVPIISLIFFGYAFTNFEGLPLLISIMVLWAILIPYPIYWYLKNRVFIQ